MAAPTEDPFPQTIIVDLEEAAMGWVVRLSDYVILGIIEAFAVNWANCVCNG